MTASWLGIASKPNPKPSTPIAASIGRVPPTTASALRATALAYPLTIGDRLLAPGQVRATTIADGIPNQDWMLPLQEVGRTLSKKCRFSLLAVMSMSRHADGASMSKT